MPDKILVVDDEANIRNSLSEVLTDEGYECLTASEGKEALRIINEEDIQLVITDLIMPEMDGMELLREVRSQFSEIKVILLTAFGKVEDAVNAMRYGAVDFLLKPVDFEMLIIKVKESFKELELRRELKWLKEQCIAKNCIECKKLIGSSAIWKRMMNQVEKLANSDITALITGESGTGKELVARHIHALSKRSESPFVPVNCGGLPDTLMESELFGVVKGAYSGALQNREGLIRSAKDGVLFLDEISELSMNAQAKLLRVLQDGELRPLGSDKVLKASCRFIAASNKDLKLEAERGNFREDLYYRISSFVLNVPPLRDRWEDIPELTKHFLYCYSSREGLTTPLLTAEAASALQSYQWPGNVRQLENVIRSTLIIKRGDYLTAEDFPLDVLESSSSPTTSSLKHVVNRFEKSFITRILNENSGDKKITAEKLDISLTTLYQKIKDLDIITS